MRIGIVVPAYNAAPWVGDAIASVIAQTFPDWRMVVVDDGSTDPTGDVVADFPDTRVRLVRQANAGVSAARNRGMAELCGGSGDALIFLDADDWLAPDALSRLAAALDASPSAVAAAGPFAFAGSVGVRCPPSGDLVERLLVGNLFANGGHLLLRWAAVRAIGGFSAGLTYGEDWEFWTRLALRGPFAADPGGPVLFVRRHPESAYRRLAADPDAFVPCTEAIFANPDLCARFGPRRLAAIRRRTEAENRWIIGRELIRHGRSAEGAAWLRRSVLAHATPRRVALLAAAHALPLLPAARRGPFRMYRASAARPQCGAETRRSGDG
jgi:glycosyltransferase involved in cell wall biosynthesis